MTSRDGADHAQIDWASLRTAYGSGEGVPGLLRRADEADADLGAAWDDLWGHLCHQGTVYTASYAAIPTLLAMCLRQEPRGYMAPLHLVGSILASNDAPEGAELMRAQHAEEVGRLRAIAERCLPLSTDDVEFIYGLETLAAFESRGVWSRSLGHLADGEVPLDCVSCGEDLLVHIEELPATVTCGDASRSSTAVEPAGVLGRAEERLVSLAMANSRPVVAARLRHLFGSVTCPECGAMFPIDTALT